jgi:hypothetical protein
MPGVRVQHPTARNARFTVTEPRPYPVPYVCTPPVFGGCGMTHLFKTHHLNLDDTGTAIVETALYGLIRHLLVLNGFSEVNEVPAPPAIGLTLGPSLAAVGTGVNIPIIQGVSGG